eukprot:6179240-Pleurochrysis_carterae.AAC.1
MAIDSFGHNTTCREVGVEAICRAHAILGSVIAHWRACALSTALIEDMLLWQVSMCCIRKASSARTSQFVSSQ